MDIAVEPAEPEAIEALRDGFRSQASCQIVHDSIIPRRLADAYALTLQGVAAGYGGVWNRYFPGRVVEFHVVEDLRDHRDALFEAFVGASGATEIEAQTNMPSMFDLLRRFGGAPVVEKSLFGDGRDTGLGCPGGTFRRRRPGDEGPEGDWVVEREGHVVAAGGVLTHYNPPYGDIYMEVSPSFRGRGLGSLIVQELRRVCHDAGLIPAARCDPDNEGSRRALRRGGMTPCGSLLAAPLQGHASAERNERAPGTDARCARRARGGRRGRHDAGVLPPGLAPGPPGHGGRGAVRSRAGAVDGRHVDGPLPRDEPGGTPGVRRARPDGALREVVPHRLPEQHGRVFRRGRHRAASSRHLREDREPWAGPTEADRAGNGSIMRLSPVVMCFHPDRGAALRYAGESSRPTHGAPECVDASRLMATILVRALDGLPKDELFSAGEGTFASGALDSIARMEFKGKGREQIRSTGYVVHTLEAALWSFWGAETSRRGGADGIEPGR